MHAIIRLSKPCPWQFGNTRMVLRFHCSSVRLHHCNTPVTLEAIASLFILFRQKIRVILQYWSLSAQLLWLGWMSCRQWSLDWPPSRFLYPVGKPWEELWAKVSLLSRQLGHRYTSAGLEGVVADGKNRWSWPFPCRKNISFLDLIFCLPGTTDIEICICFSSPQESWSANNVMTRIKAYEVNVNYIHCPNLIKKYK